MNRDRNRCHVCFSVSSLDPQDARDPPARLSLILTHILRRGAAGRSSLKNGSCRLRPCSLRQQGNIAFQRHQRIRESRRMTSQRENGTNRGQERSLSLWLDLCSGDCCMPRLHRERGMRLTFKDRKIKWISFSLSPFTFSLLSFSSRLLIRQTEEAQDDET